MRPLNRIYVVILFKELEETGIGQKIKHTERKNLQKSL